MSHLDTQSPRARVVLTLVTTGMYAFVFILLRRSIGPNAAILSLVPVVVAGWQLGARAGALAGLLLFPVNAALLYQAGAAGWDLPSTFLGTAVMLVAGVTVGRLHDLHAEVKRELVERRRAEEQQVRLRHKLEQTNIELQEAVRAKVEMIQNVSHELRTPLTHIMGYSDLLSMSALERGLGEDEQRAITIIQEQMQNLAHLVDMLLDIQTLEVEDLALEEVNLTPLVSEAETAWQKKAQEVGTTLSRQIGRRMQAVQGDWYRLRQVLDVLLDNAFKFTGEGDEVSVQIEHRGDEMLLSVSDTGIGIPPHEADRIFEPFHQVNGSTTRHYGGAGIGLTLAHHIVSLHNGRIWAESEGEGHGTTFHVALPVALIARQPALPS